MGGGAAKLEMEVWTEGSRLLRLDIPAQMLSVLRDDIASVSARLVTMARPNDEHVSIPANGFSLAATISRPVAAAQPAPAPAAKAGARAAAGRRAGVGLRADRSRRVRRGHSDLRAAGQRARRCRLSRRSLRRARRGPERRPPGIGDDRGIRRRRARGRDVPAEADATSTRRESRSSATAKAAGSRCSSPRASRRSRRSA